MFSPSRLPLPQARSSDRSAHSARSARSARSGLRAVARAARLCAALLPLPALVVHAQDSGAVQAAAQEQRAFQLPAGPLEPALYAFGSQAGITLSFDPALAQGLRTAGLQGRYTVGQGLAELLRATGLQAVRGASGAWQLRRQSDAGPAPQSATALPTVTVQDQAERSAVTEGSGSYAPREVTVAGKRPTPWKEVPASVSVITRQRIEDQNLVTVEDALRQVAGVTAISYGDGTAYFKARGHDSDVQYDGLPANNGLQYRSQFDLAMYDRLEVLRGPGGVLQGAGGAAGTVNLVRKRPQADPAFNASLSAGSWGRGRAELDVSRPLNASGSVRGRAVLAGQSDGSFLDAGRSKHVLAYGVVEADLAPSTQLTASFSNQNRNARGIDYGVGVHTDGSFVRAPRSAFFGTDWSNAHGRTQEVFAELAHRFAGDWQAKLSYLDRRVESHSRYGYLQRGVSSDNRANYWLQGQEGDTTWRALDANLGGSFTLAGRRHEALLGLNRSWRDDTSLSYGKGVGAVDIFQIQVPDQPLPQTFASRTRSEQSGVYGQLRLNLAEPLTLALGGRVSWYESRALNLRTTPLAWAADPSVNRQFTPQLGLVYAVAPAWSLYANYSEIFQPQTQLSLGNKALKPREGRQAELGAKGVFLDGRLNASLAAFEIKDENRAVVDPDNPTFYLARGKVRSRGWEAEVSGRLRPGWDLYAGYTRLDTRYLADPANLGRVYSEEEPRHTVKLWTRYALQDKALRGWHVAGGARIQSSTSRGAAAQGGYTVVDAQLGYQIDRHLAATLSLNNVFDKAYYARVPSGFYSVWGDPRNVMLTLRASY